MKNHNATLLAVIAGTGILFVAFVSYRARTFHYCDGSVNGAEQSRLADKDGFWCPGEQPKEWRALWREGATRPKAQIVGQHNR